MQKWVKGGESPRYYSNWCLCGVRRGDWGSCWSSCHWSFIHSWIHSFSHGLVWCLLQPVLQRHWRSPEKFQQGNQPLPLRCHLLGWIFFSGDEKKGHPQNPLEIPSMRYRLIYTNVHPYMLFMQSTRTYYMVETINIQIFSQDSPQTIDSEHNCKITSYDHINKS